MENNPGKWTAYQAEAGDILPGVSEHRVQRGGARGPNSTGWKDAEGHLEGDGGER